MKRENYENNRWYLLTNNECWVEDLPEEFPNCMTLIYNKNARFGDIGFLKDVGTYAVSDDSHNVKIVYYRTDKVFVPVDDSNVVFLTEFLRKGAADLSAAYNYNIHRASIDFC